MKHISFNTFALIVYLTVSNHPILSVEQNNQKAPVLPKSASLNCECMAGDAESRSMMLKLYGIPILTKDQQDEKTKLQFQQAERRSEAYNYLKKTKIGDITQEHLDIVAYLQDDVQITRPTSEEILNYIYLSGTYLPLMSTTSIASN